MAEMAVETENDVFHIVFMIVLFSILLQGSLLPLVAKKLDMIDEKGDVMKTFNDYPMKFRCSLSSSVFQRAITGVEKH